MLSTSEVLSCDSVCTGLPERQLQRQLLPAESALPGGAPADRGALRGHVPLQPAGLLAGAGPADDPAARGHPAAQQPHLPPLPQRLCGLAGEHADAAIIIVISQMPGIF